jgi:hypothetical protein
LFAKTPTRISLLKNAGPYIRQIFTQAYWIDGSSRNSSVTDTFPMLATVAHSYAIMLLGPYEFIIVFLRKPLI